MSRKKKNNIEEEVTYSNELIYCGYIKCPHTECLRHNINTPYDVLILRRNFSPDKDWNCKDIITER